MTDSRLLAFDLASARGITLAWCRIGQDMELAGAAAEEDVTARDQLLALASALPENEQAQLSEGIRHALAVRTTRRDRANFTRLLIALAASPHRLTPDDRAAAADSADGLFAAGRADFGQEILPLLRDARHGSGHALDDAIAAAYAMLPPAPLPRTQPEAEAYQRGRRDVAREILAILRGSEEAGQCLSDLAGLAYAQLPPYAPGTGPDAEDPPLAPCTRPDCCGSPGSGNASRTALESARLAAEAIAEARVLGVHLQAPAEGMNGGVPGLFITLEDVLALLARISPFRGLAGSSDADVLEAAARLVMRWGGAEPNGAMLSLARDYLARLADRARSLDDSTPDQRRAASRENLRKMLRTDPS